MSGSELMDTDGEGGNAGGYHRSQSVSSDDGEDFQNSTHYQDVFKPLCCLGRGSGGVVMKVKHLTDRQEYAMKIIQFEKEDSKPLREARYLSSLNHENVVRYYSSWRQIPYNCPPSLAGSLSSLSSVGEMSLSGSHSSSSSSKMLLRGIGFAGDSRDFPVYEYIENDACGQSQRTEEPKNIFLKLPSLTLKIGDFDLAKKENIEGPHTGGLGTPPYIAPELRPPNQVQPNSKDYVVLFITMELCSKDLDDWLRDRNDKLNLDVTYGNNVSLAQQLMKGLSYIHSMGIIHRDLKPKNIFLKLPSLTLKIGDFDLAKKENIEGPHTGGLGTPPYIAPELRPPNQVQPNSKSDMYSAGIVLFELFSAFRTEQEKCVHIGSPMQSPSLTNIRKKWPQQSDIIISLMSDRPESRPEAKTILDVMFVKQKTAKDKPLSGI